MIRVIQLKDIIIIITEAQAATTLQLHWHHNALAGSGDTASTAGVPVAASAST